MDWKKYFDAVFVLHYAGYTGIEERLHSELERVGLTGSGILTVHNNISSPFLNALKRGIELDRVDASDRDGFKDSAFSCSFGHYSLLKVAELKGVERALILEDDVVFAKDVGLIEKTLDSVSGETGQAGYDVCLFSHFQSPCCERPADVPKYVSEMAEAKSAGRMAIPFDSNSAAVASGAAYGVSRRGAVLLRGLYEHQFQLADMIFRDIPYHAAGSVDAFHKEVLAGMRRFYCRVPICLQNNVTASMTGDILGGSFAAVMARQRQIAEAAGIRYSDYNFQQ